MSQIDEKNKELKIEATFKDVLFFRFWGFRGKLSQIGILTPEEAQEGEETINRILQLIQSNKITAIDINRKTRDISIKVKEVIDTPEEALTREEIDRLFTNKAIQLLISVIVEEVFNSPKKGGKKKAEEVKEKKTQTKYSIHLINQRFDQAKQLKIFSDIKVEEELNNQLEALSESKGIEINKPERFGLVLNQTELRVLEGILQGFTNTDYLGDEEIDKQSYVKTTKHPVDKINRAYSNINKIPVIRLTQAELISLAGYDLSKQRQGDKNDVTEALSVLATKQFGFYWDRLVYHKGKPAKDKSGKYIKEGVMEVGSILRVKYVRNEAQQLLYYEIHPSAVILDQIDSRYGGNYFLLVPNNWREEVKQLTGTRESSYTYEFLIWLRLQFEQIRRHNSQKRKPKPFSISQSWEEIAIALRMPPTMYKANRKRANKIIQDAYSVAIKLGYLIKVINNGATDTLYLNEGFYPKPGELTSEDLVAIS